MFHIRFVKAPAISAITSSEKKQTTCLLTLLVSISNDLGDFTYPYSADLKVIARIHASSSVKAQSEVIATQTVRWNSTLRHKPIVVPLSIKKLNKRTFLSIQLTAETIEETVADAAEDMHWWEDDFHGLVDVSAGDTIKEWKNVEFVPVRSSPMLICDSNGEILARKASRTVWRELNRISVSEENGEEIARHVWDAGLITMKLLGSEQEFRGKLNTLLADSGLKVLELGTGCGLVGLRVAKELNTEIVCLTDLPDAEEISRRNIAANKCSEMTFFSEFDWADADVPKSGSEKADQSSDWDLILVTDCTYNSGSYEMLVDTLDKLTRDNVDAVVLLAHKFRCPLDEVEVFKMLILDDPVLKKTGNDAAIEYKGFMQICHDEWVHHRNEWIRVTLMRRYHEGRS